jgi:predicted nuclease of predicted toxin-antitoxin system
VNARFFIDECLSAALVAVAKDRDYPAVFGPHLGMGGWQDWNIAKFAVENGYVVVTNNRRDFLREYLKYDAHPGLVVLVPHVERSVQIALFSEMLNLLDANGDNRADMLIEVRTIGPVQVRRWNADEHDVRHIATPVWPD